MDRVPIDGGKKSPQGIMSNEAIQNSYTMNIDDGSGQQAVQNSFENTDPYM